MKNQLKLIPIITLFILTGLLFLPQTSAALSISSPESNSNNIKIFEKYEAKFQINTSAVYPFFEYSPNPPSGLTPKTGITVTGEFINTSTNQTYFQPAFFMTEVTRSGTGKNIQFTETNQNTWAVRFSPQSAGNYDVYINAEDSTGKTRSKIGSFTTDIPTKPGFIKVSDNDSRYFEYTNGQIYWPIGPAWLDRGNGDYSNYKDTGLNLERPWMGGKGAYTSNWARWWSSIERHGNEGVTTHLSWTEQDTSNNSELSYELYYPDASRYWLSEYHSNNLYTPLKVNTRYQIKLRYKNVNITGPRTANLPFGLTVKIHETIWGGENYPATQLDPLLQSKPILVSHLTQNGSWQTFQNVITTPSSIPGTDLSIMLDNITGGRSYISEFSIKECLNPECTLLGGEIIRNSKSDIHTYVDQRASAYFDWQVEQAEKNGVYLKFVVHDKNDWIQNHLKSTGEWSNNADGYYQSENSKARWLLRQWYRYLVARYGYSTSIFAWELNNEGPPNEEGNGTAKHWETAEAFAKYIKSIDSHPHLATTSFWCCWRPNFWGNNSKFPNIDYADIHDYINTNGDSALREYSGQTPSYLDVADWKYRTATMVKNSNINKPTLVGETGIINTNWQPLPELQINNTGVWFHNMLWVELADAVIYDFNFWFPELLERFDRTITTKSFANFIKDLDFNKGGYISLGEISFTNSNLRAFGQKNLTKDKAVLWIQNKNHTWRNALNNPNSDYSLTGDLTIKMSSNKQYPISYYNTYTGQTIKTTSASSDPTGNLTINLDNLNKDVAIKVGDFSNNNDTNYGNSIPTITEDSITPTPTLPQYNPDINNDGIIDTKDIIYFQTLYGSNSNGDINLDGIVNSVDFGYIYRAIYTNNTVPPEVTPTPTITVQPVPTTLIPSPTNTPPSPTPTPTRIPTPTLTPTPTIIQTITPTPTTITQIQTSSEWSQFGGNAQRTHYTPNSVPTPWTWKWAWNGPTSTGTVSSNKFRLPRNSQPIAGDNKVFVSAGTQGVYAINNSNGTVAWNFTQASVNSTPAYYNNHLYVLANNGTLYKLSSTNGSVAGTFSLGASSTWPLPPAIHNGTIYVGMGSNVYAINTNNMSQTWRYQTGGSNVATPVSFSQTKNIAVVVTTDLFVHAINNTGAQLWRNKPTPRNAGNPGGGSTNLAEAFNSWPVIADQNGYVIIKYRLDWNELWRPSPWENNNQAIRTRLSSTPTSQAMYVLDLNNGNSPFIANVGHGGFGNNDYLPMGPQAVVAKIDNQELAYVVMRGSNCLASPCDGRWDSRLGEMMLNNNTVTGYEAGYVRFMNNTFFPTDEQAYISMAGNQIYGGHWMFGFAHQITDRSSSRGSSSTNPILTSNLPHIITSTTSCSFSSSHYCSGSITQDGDARTLPYGFYIYYNQGSVYDRYWSEYASWTISGNNLYYVATDGSIVAISN